MARVDLLKNSSKLFWLIIAAGFLLRIWGLDFGLPHQFHQDEPIVVNHAMAYGMGDLNPRFFAIPPLTSYILFGIYIVKFAIGLVAGLWQNPDEFALAFFRDPSTFYVVGRSLIGVLPSMIAVLLTYRLSLKFLSKSASLYAAAIMSFSFLNVINAHYIYTDMLLTVFILFAYMSLYSMYRSSVTRNYCIAGFFIGLATGTKYNGILLLLPYLLLHLAVSPIRGKGFIRSLISKKLWTGIAISVIVFVAVNPFALLDFRVFLSSVTHQSGAFWYTGWTHHITYSLFQGISIPLTILGISGVLFFAAKGDKWKRVVSVFPLAFYLVLVFRSQHFSRYVLFLVPFISMGAGYFVFDFLREHTKRTGFSWVAVLLSLLFLIPTTVKSIKADILFSSQDTRIIASDWIRENIPEGTKFAVDHTFFRPALDQPYSQLVEKKEYLDTRYRGGRSLERKLEYMIKASDRDSEGYPIYFLSEEPSSQGQFLNTLPAVSYDIGELKDLDIGYVIINSLTSNPGKDIFLNRNRQYLELVKEFSPYVIEECSRYQDTIALTCMPVSDNDVFSRIFTGPHFLLYRIPGSGYKITTKVLSDEI